MPNSRLHFALICVAAVAAGCVSIPAEPAPRVLSIEIQPGKVAEECFKMAAGERIDYRSQASGAVDFNLHTHRGKELVMPVDVRATRAQSGIYSSTLSEDYCLMWTNAAAVPAHVTGEWRRLRH